MCVLGVWCESAHFKNFLATPALIGAGMGPSLVELLINWAERAIGQWGLAVLMLETLDRAQGPGPSVLIPMTGYPGRVYMLC